VSGLLELAAGREDSFEQLLAGAVAPGLADLLRE